MGLCLRPMVIRTLAHLTILFLYTRILGKEGVYGFYRANFSIECSWYSRSTRNRPSEDAQKFTRNLSDFHLRQNSQGSVTKIFKGIGVGIEWRRDNRSCPVESRAVTI